MYNMCPFRKKRVANTPQEWEEHFMECVKEKCAVWNEGSCGMSRTNMVLNPALNNPINTDNNHLVPTDATLIIKSICDNTGATQEQVRMAVKRAENMEKKGKVKGNFIKLVEAITATIVKEDLLKNSRKTIMTGDEEVNLKKKDFIKSLYMS
jgi:hypothetical protein